MWTYDTSVGSPPRVRGTVGDVDDVYGDVGITPACAGNSIEELKNSVLNKDHPRVCGEQEQETSKVVAFAGSPPRVRGTEPIQGDLGQDLGITPACAGNRLSQSTLRATWKDHPRVCGEQE